MKMRGAIYSKEAAELLRIITTYKALTSAQVYQLFPGKEEKIKTILSHLITQSRIFYDKNKDILAASEECLKDADTAMTAAFWVLLDFIDRAEYHTAGDFPVKISFFADGEMFEIICVMPGQEALVSHALTVSGDDPPRRLIIVEDPKQAEEISIPNTAGFCVVARDGTVTYYKVQEQEE
ncbi:MAG: DUF5697 family protein [Oscillospiraceae bacterium]|jgi:hypothetical protein|nr:DUF5697 family protein [Oscillospiraceae bacterium]